MHEWYVGSYHAQTDYSMNFDKPLTTLNLRGESNINMSSNRKKVHLNLTDNNIGTEGTRLIGEELKINSTLTELILSSDRKNE